MQTEKVSNLDSNHDPPIGSTDLTIKYGIGRSLYRMTNYRLTFSNKPLQMLTYREYVKYLVRSASRSSTSSTFSVLSIAALKRFINHNKEYWYMGSMLARSAVANRK
jgi:hypothetical protein